MKKILFAAMALVAISFASCNGCAGQLDEIQKAADSQQLLIQQMQSLTTLTQLSTHSMQQLTLLKLSLRNNSCELSSRT